jgi:hypothetical protein
MATRKKQVLLLAVPAIILIIAAIAAAFLFSTGVLYAGVKSSNQKVLVYQNVCSDDLKNRFVEVLQPTSSESKGTIQQIHEEIEGLADWKNDPSCVHMNLQYFIAQGQVDQVTELVREQDALSKIGRFADPVVSRYGSSGTSAAGAAQLQRDGATNAGQGGI